MTMRARFFAKGDRRWLCAPWSRSMFFHLMKYGGEPPPPQPAARASPCCAATRARLLLPQSCHQPCKSKARKSEGRATSAMESVQSQIAPRCSDCSLLVHSAAATRRRWVGCRRHSCTLAHCMAWCFSYMYLALPQLFFVSHQAAALQAP